MNFINYQSDSIQNQIKQVEKYEKKSIFFCFSFLKIDIEELVKKGNDLVQELNIRLHINEIKNKENNQIREVHTWARKFEK